MPRYDYLCDCGNFVKDVWCNSFTNAKKTVKCTECGGRAEKYFGNLARSDGVNSTTGDRAWPFACEAMAVDPTDIKMAAAEAKRLGVPTDFDSLGRPIMRDREHRKRFHQAFGVYDKQGGYGDATEKTWHKDAANERAHRRADDKFNEQLQRLWERTSEY